MHRSLVSLMLLLFPLSLLAAETRVLLPVYFEQPISGAFGSVWHVQFAAHNGSPCSYGIASCPYLICLAIDSEDMHLRANETQTTLPAMYPKRANGVAGTMMYLAPESTTCTASDPQNDLSFALRIVDSSRSDISAGTELPVVRESAFHHTALNLLDIPSGGVFRLTLRIFEMDLDRADFRVRVYDQTANTIAAELTLTTTAEEPGGPSGPPLNGDYRFYPAFTEVPLTAAGVSNRLRVEVEPLTAGAAFWAYVSITNNVSQQVTIVTPQ